MKAEEYLNENKIQNEYGGYDVAEEDALEAIEIACKEEREKININVWHDLRKSPNDLPNHKNSVIILLSRGVGYEKVVASYENGNYPILNNSESEVKPAWIYEGGWSDDIILAWMDIPFFKLDD